MADEVQQRSRTETARPGRSSARRPQPGGWDG